MLFDKIKSPMMQEFTLEEHIIIADLKKKLYYEAEILFLVSNSIEEDLHNDDAQAQDLLNTAMRRATHQFTEIGHELNAYGGFALMQQSINEISKAGLRINVIDHAWDGIGDWVV